MPTSSGETRLTGRRSPRELSLIGRECTCTLLDSSTALHARRHSLRPAVGGARGDATLVELDDAVSDGEEAIVVGDDDTGLAEAAQLRQELFVEELLERGILIGGPFVEHANGSIVDQ